MKKVFSVMMCSLILFGITGCVSELKSNDDKNGVEKTTFQINETAKFKNVNYTVTNVKYSDGNDFDKPAEGKTYVIVTLKIENKSDSKISYNTFDWKMINSQGQEDSETFTTVDNDTSLNSGDLAPGGSKTGTLVFEQPKEETSLKLLYYANSFWDENSAFEIVIK